MFQKFIDLIGDVRYDIFISYRRKEGDYYANALANYLSDKGFHCYLDQHVRDGDQEKLPESIKEAAKKSRMLIIVGTKGVDDSHWIPQEINSFLARENGIIVPIDLDNILTAKWFSLVGKYQRND